MALSHLPAILCLHGSGTNSTIFNVQSIRIQRALTKTFEFVFINAPFERSAGPGVLPVFEGCDPFLSWHHPSADSALELAPPETIALLQKTLDERKKLGPGRGFVAVMGFSQGCRVAAGLLGMQQGSQSGEGTLKFGVFLNGTSPPLSADPELLNKAGKLRFPSLHVLGRDDPWADDGRDMAYGWFEEGRRRVLETGAGHHLPVVQEDTDAIVRGILEVYEESMKCE
ncbi:hypothetical protein B7494_g7312 [Chlorociboria aeruginascens]|nr:hypothetical protein B7494_g7312 [Chlorociboria aeruginascens]